MPDESARKSVPINVVVVGSCQSGKSAILNRKLHGTFSYEYLPTLRVEFRQWRPACGGKLNFWEIGGDRSYQAFPSHASYVQRADILVFVYNVTDPGSAYLLDRAVLECSLLNSAAHRILVGAKSDLPTSRRVFGYVDRVMSTVPFQYHLRCSASRNVGIAELFTAILQLSSKKTKTVACWKQPTFVFPRIARLQAESFVV